MKKIMRCVVVISALALTACTPNTSQYAANSYNTSQVNTRQETKTIEIIAISPAKIMVDNTKQKERAQRTAALVGALAGGAIGNNSGSGSNTNTAVGAVGGAAGGALIAGAAVKDTVETEGVSLTFKENGKVFTSTQVGKSCEFTVGIAVMLSTGGNETRIQPNATCPQPKKA
ncbi:hypothetical protein [Yokenella regensburgei]|uniref:hypothetical protein n=1 Tax=Yokenella regensburgei TaxID=158877 RepID=UPI0031D0A0E5